MNRLVLLLVGLAMLLAPLVAAVPEGMVGQSLLPTAILAGMGSALTAIVLASTALSAISFRGTAIPSPIRMPILSFAALVVWAGISILGIVATSHPATAYLDPMLRAICKLGSYFGIFAVCALLAYKQRESGYSVLAFITVGGGIAAVIGLQEYLTHARDGDIHWRIFGTSSPDYLAAYLLLVFPITLALALSVNEKTLKGLLYLVALVEMATIFPTGSRFALLPLVLELVLFGGLYLRSQKGHAVAGPSKKMVAGAVFCVLLVAATLGKPVIQRLTHNQKNSGAFRVLTWKGSLHMAEAHPLIGTGLGTWEYCYQKYALAGFTRMAHNSYLQLADDSGFPAVAILAVLIFAVATVGFKGALSSKPSDQKDETPGKDDTAAPLLASTDVPVIIGLLAGTVAVSIQNLIDSDWYVFAIGATSAAAAGVMAGLVARQPQPTGDKARLSVPAAIVVAVAAIAGAIFSAMTSAGLLIGKSAADTVRSNPTEAEELYSNAITWAPLNGRILSELGYRIQFGAQRNAQSATQTLHAAVDLMPDSVSYRRLGDVYAASGQSALAMDAYKHGLLAEPHSVDLLIDLAHTVPKEQALEYYRALAQQEVSPVGQIRALEDITDPRYAIADAQMGDDATAKGDTGGAITYYRRAQAILDKYAEEGGSADTQHMALSGGRPDPDADKQYADLYSHVTSAAEPLLPSQDRQNYHAGSAIGQAHFAVIKADALLAMGNNQEAQAAYATAQQAVQDADKAVQVLTEPAKSARVKQLTGLADSLKKRIERSQLTPTP